MLLPHALQTLLCPYPPLTGGKALAAVDVLPWGNGSTWESRQPQYLPVQGRLAAEMDAFITPGSISTGVTVVIWAEKMEHRPGSSATTQSCLSQCCHGCTDPSEPEFVPQDMEGDADFPAWTSSL